MNSMIGHNNPPTDHDMIRESMGEKNAKALKRSTALIEAADRVPEKVEDQETSDKITDLEKQVTVCYNALETARKDDKAPYWEMCKVVDGFFADPLEALAAAKKRIKKIQTAYHVEQEQKERQRRADLAREEQEKRDKELADAQRLEVEGKKSQADAAMDKAVEHDHDAAFFSEAARATGSSVSASTGEMTGARSSLRYVDTGEITDPSILDLEALRPYIKLPDLQKALNSFVKVNGTTKQIPGAKIWKKPEAVTR